MLSLLSHTTDDDDRTYRTPEEIARERVNDPIPTFDARLTEAGVIEADASRATRHAVTRLVDETTDPVEGEPLPDADDLCADVYAGSHDAWVS
jgi:2-oxoisovalerate dehydrogenase E1 component alpha subunit